MKNHAQFLSLRRFQALDGLRAISIIAVIWHHTAPTWPGSRFNNIGAQGVNLFFAISGFLITTLLIRERERNGKIDLKAFYIRRALRIFPLYYGVLGLYISVVFLLERHTAEGKAFFDNLIYFATYTSNLFVPLKERVIFYFAWSLAAEEQFYLLWPPLLIITGTRAYIPLCLTLIACILGQLSGNQFLSSVPFAIIASALLAIAMHTKRGFGLVQMLLGKVWSSGFLIIILVIALTILSIPAFLIDIIFAALVVSCVINDDNIISKLLAIKFVSYIGSISYGMYLLHMLCKHMVVKLLMLSTNGLEVFCLTFLMSVAAAGISFKYYESFFLRVKSRYQR